MKKKIIPQKRLGQNFLINRGVQTRIVHTCALKSTDFVLEIGPGKGALTKDILQVVHQLWVVEKDPRCVEYLAENIQDGNLTVYNEDILQFDWRKLPNGAKVVGNLPYNISTPILELIIKNREKISECFLMIQLEFAKRLLAQPNSKIYGSLSCFTQLFMDGKILFKIKNTSFYPPPKVTSAFVHFKVLPQPRYVVKDEEFLFDMIKQGFKHRRKMMIKNLGDYGAREDLQRAFKKSNIALNSRAENCSLQNFITLAEVLH